MALSTETSATLLLTQLLDFITLVIKCVEGWISEPLAPLVEITAVALSPNLGALLGILPLKS